MRLFRSATRTDPLFAASQRIPRCAAPATMPEPCYDCGRTGTAPALVCEDGAWQRAALCAACQGLRAAGHVESIAAWVERTQAKQRERGWDERNRS